MKRFSIDIQFVTIIVISSFIAGVNSFGFEPGNAIQVNNRYIHSRPYQSIFPNQGFVVVSDCRCPREFAECQTVPVFTIAYKNTICYTLFNSAGSIIKEPSLLFNITTSRYGPRLIAVKTINNNQFFIIYATSTLIGTSTSYRRQVYYAKFSISGEMIGNEVYIEDFTDGSCWNQEITNNLLLINDNTVFTWKCRRSGSIKSRAALFSPAGDIIGSSGNVFYNDIYNCIPFKGATLNNGNFVLGCLRNVHNSKSNILIQMYSASGSPIGEYKKMEYDSF